MLRLPALQSERAWGSRSTSCLPTAQISHETSPLQPGLWASHEALSTPRLWLSREQFDLRSAGYRTQSRSLPSRRFAVRFQPTARSHEPPRPGWIFPGPGEARPVLAGGTTRPPGTGKARPAEPPSEQRSGTLAEPSPYLFQRSSSSPPQPQKALGKPLIFWNCSTVRPLTPPKNSL